MNKYELAALQLSMFQQNDPSADWIASLSKPPRFSRPSIAYHKNDPAVAGAEDYAINTTESRYIWNLGRELVCFSTQIN